MKLNRQQFFDKINKLRRDGFNDFVVKSTPTSVRLHHSGGFDVVMGARNVPLGDKRKTELRDRTVALETYKYQRWLREWTSQHFFGVNL